MSKQSVYFEIPGLSGKHEVGEIKNGLARSRGVTSVSVSPDTDRVAVDYDSTGTDAEKIAGQIRKLGFDAHVVEHEDHVM